MSKNLKECIETVMDRYLDESAKPFGGNWLASFIRDDFAAAIQIVCKGRTNLKVIGSPGKGIWAKCPHVDVMDDRITSTARKGFYVVYLFSTDMSCVYLSLIQGVSEKVEEIGLKATRDWLVGQSVEMQSILSYDNGTFSDGDIDLKPIGNLQKLYQLGNVISKRYDKGSIPSQAELESDLLKMVDAYQTMGFTDEQLAEEALNESGLPITSTEDRRKARIHLQYDRRNSKKVKKLKGYVCEVCSLDMKELYGYEYAEAHHLKPVATLIGIEVTVDLEKDFAVLCPNCHRMIHKQDDPSDLESLRSKLNRPNAVYTYQGQL